MAVPKEAAQRSRPRIPRRRICPWWDGLCILTSYFTPLSSQSLLCNSHPATFLAAMRSRSCNPLTSPPARRACTYLKSPRRRDASQHRVYLIAANSNNPGFADAHTLYRLAWLRSPLGMPSLLLPPATTMSQPMTQTQTPSFHSTTR